MDKQELVSGILDVFTRALGEELREAGPEAIQVDWSLAATPDAPPEFSWWSGGLASHPGAAFFIGAPDETWEKLGRSSDSEDTRENAFALVTRCFQKAVTERFGNDAATQDCGPCEAPAANGTRATVEIGFPAGHWPSAGAVLNPEFEQALGSTEETANATAPTPYSPPPATARQTQSDMLMHVQVPVSVSFGGTQIRMRDLLNLTAGSVVELDQALHDNVDVRINDRLIARGEVVAVDGHYGVRVLELVSADSSPGKGSRA